MFEQALAKVMNLGLNCRQVTGPVCFPSRSATFIPLSAFHTCIFPSSDPGKQNVEETGITLCELISSPFWIYWWRLTDHDELRVWRERGFQNDTFTVVITLQWRRKTLLNLKPKLWQKAIQNDTNCSPQMSGALLLWKHPALWVFHHWWGPESAFRRCWTWDPSTHMFAHIVV